MQKMAWPEPLTTRQSQRQPRRPLQVKSPSYQNVLFRRRPSQHPSTPPPSYSTSQQQQRQHRQQQAYALRPRSTASQPMEDSPPPSPHPGRLPRRPRRRASDSSESPPPDWRYRHPNPDGFSSGRLPHAPMLPRRPRQLASRRKSCPGLWNVVSQTVELVELVDTRASGLERHLRECMAHGEDMYAMMGRTLDQVITLIDEGLFSRQDEDCEFFFFFSLCYLCLVLIWLVEANVCIVLSDYHDYDEHEHEHEHEYDYGYHQAPQRIRKRRTTKKDSSALSYFSRVYLYHNSRLPSRLPPLKL